MKKEARKLNFFERVWLRALMPDLNKYKKKYSQELTEEDNYIILNRNDYELMKKMVDRQDNYIKQIKMSNEEIDKLKNKLAEKEKARRKVAGKVGGLTGHLNYEKKQNKMLLDKVLELESAKELQEIELEKAKIQNKILKDTGKKKQIEDFKKLIELNNEIKKRKKSRR